MPAANPSSLLRTAQTQNIARSLSNPSPLPQQGPPRQAPIDPLPVVPWDYQALMRSAGMPIQWDQPGPIDPGGNTSGNNGPLEGPSDPPPIGSSPGDYGTQPLDENGYPVTTGGYTGDPNPYYEGPHADNYGRDPFGDTGGYDTGDSPGPSGGGNPYRDNASGPGHTYNSNDPWATYGPQDAFYPDVTEVDSTPEPWYGRLARMLPLPYGANLIPQTAHTIMQAHRNWNATHPHSQGGPPRLNEPSPARRPQGDSTIPWYMPGHRVDPGIQAAIQRGDYERDYGQSRQSRDDLGLMAFIARHDPTNDAGPDQPGIGSIGGVTSGSIAGHHYHSRIGTRNPASRYYQYGDQNG